MQRPFLQKPAALRIVAAWLVHFYTGLGLVCAAIIAILIHEGSPEAIRAALLWMFLAVVIDATDGTLARWVGVKVVLPEFDGRRLDDIIDFLTYTFLPLYLLWRIDILPGLAAWWLLFPLLASAYGFCQTHIKSPEGYFKGFPSYWNLVALYVYLLDFPAWLTILTVLGLGVMTFVPSLYLYPSQPGRLNRAALALGIPWGLLLLWILVGASEKPGDRQRLLLATISLYFPAFYLGASALATWQARAGRRQVEGSQELARPAWPGDSTS